MTHLSWVHGLLIMSKPMSNLEMLPLSFLFTSKFLKKSILWYGVIDDETKSFASILNLQPSSLPCSYLGLPIGENMNIICNWKPIVNKFHNRLTSWKAKTRSYGGRLTLLKSVLGARGTYFFPLYKAPAFVCSSKANGGLGIESLQASNLAMLTKWWWRFRTESNSLWKAIINSIHGVQGGFNFNENQISHLPNSPWKSLIKLKKPLSQLSINLSSIFSKKVRNGETFAFWNNEWLGNTKLRLLFLRMYELETIKGCLISDRCHLLNGSCKLTWAWRRSVRDGLDMEQFRELLGFLVNFIPNSNSSLLSIEDQVRWNKCLPIKINVHTWRQFRGSLPTRYNLDIREIDLHSSLCPVCDEEIETSKHLFIDCSIASQLWKLVCYWWGFYDYPKDICGLITWADSVDLNGNIGSYEDTRIEFVSIQNPYANTLLEMIL
ncbi:reverse transcriptase domain, reverse transcriptase zinc-binding domain protein [Tanacetum coccineum]